MAGEAPSPLTLALVVALAVLSVSTAAILIRLSQAPPLVIAFWRLLLATLILAPFALARHHRDLARLAPRDAAALGLVGVVLALHFATWIASLAYTTVAASVVLVTMHPVLVGLASGRIYGEGLSPRAWLGVAVALAGAATIAIGDYGLGGNNLLGDGLAFAGAVAMAAYLLAGRGYRRRMALLPYVLVVYAAATAALAAMVALAGNGFTGYAPREYGLFLALALVPMILGHTLINWALEYVEAPVISTTILGEPVGSTLLALVVLEEVPPLVTLVGGAVVLAGIYLVAREGFTAEAVAEASEAEPPA